MQFIVAAGSAPPTLPPSVEEAYKKKCIELKRRMNEVEESNDSYRLRKVRLMRGIRKMRLERAFLLEILGKRMKKNGAPGPNGTQGFYDEYSEGSSEGPPTPLEKPLRSKRSHRRPVPSPPPSIAHHLSLPSHPSQLNPNPPYPEVFQPHHEPNFSQVPTTNGNPTMHVPSHATPFPPPNSSVGVANHVPTTANHPISPPRPFDDFYETRFLAHPEQYPNCHTETELLHRARRTWNDLPDGERERWKARYEHNYQAYHMQLGEMRGRPRERQRYEAPREREEEMDGGGGGGGGGGGHGTSSGGGFTAVNT